MNSKTLIGMTALSTFCFCLVVLFIAHREPLYLDQASRVYHGKRIEAGGTLYEMHCRSCHGLKGEGVGQLGPPLADKHFFTARLKELGLQSSLEEFVIATIEFGRLIGTRPIYAGNGSTAVMPAWSQDNGGFLRGDEVRNISTFVLNWEATARGSLVFETIEVPDFETGIVRNGDGKAVFIEHCSKCHQFADTADPEFSGPDLTLIKSKADTIPDISPPEFIQESILVPAARIASGFEIKSEENPCGSMMTERELELVTEFLLQ